MLSQVQETLKNASEELGLSPDDLLLQGLRHYLENQLHEVQANIFQITGQYNVSGVEDMETRYRDGSIEESSSWRDLQRLDHLEYKRDRLLRLIEALP